MGRAFMRWCARQPLMGWAYPASLRARLVGASRGGGAWGSCAVEQTKFLAAGADVAWSSFLQREGSGACLDARGDGVESTHFVVACGIPTASLGSRFTVLLALSVYRLTATFLLGVSCRAYIDQ